MPDYRLHHGDCLEVLKALPDGCVHSVVTDPPYGLSFMGKKWDYDVPGVDIWRECLRALKPGGHLLAFGGSRTYHRMAVNIEDAGFEIRDQIQWIYGSGFPKSLSVSKAIDKAAGAEREVIGNGKAGRTAISDAAGVVSGYRPQTYRQEDGRFDITAPATEAAKQWDGWGSALKPAFEPLVVGYKPLINIDEFDIMVREVIETLCQSTSIARIAEKSFQSNHVGAGQSIAQWVADGNINIGGVLSVLTDTLRSESVTNTNLSIASLWLDTLAVLYSQANTFTTETKISLTIELRILRSLPLANILEHIIRGETPQNGDATSAYTARNIFNVVIEKLRHILEHSVPETAMSKAGQTGLLPNHEPIVMARKPLDGTIAANVLRHGCGALNIDGCRVESNRTDTRHGGGKHSEHIQQLSPDAKGYALPPGRWPANIIHNGSDEVVGLFPQTTSTQSLRGDLADHRGNCYKSGNGKTIEGSNSVRGHNDAGSAARFFKQAAYDEIELFFERAKSIMDVCNLYPAHTANDHSNLSNQHVDSVLKRVVIGASRGDRQLNDLTGLSTIATPNLLKIVCEAVTLTILSLEKNVSHDLLRDVNIPNGCRVRVAETNERTGITTITINPPILDGYAEGVTLSITRTSSGVGAKGSNANRYIYCAKASKKDRNEGLEGFEIKQSTGGGGGIGDYLNDVNSASGKFGSEKAPAANNHPTVKPTELMRYLCRLVTPPNGTVLDPFAGSGSTGKAASLEGFKFVGIEKEAEYIAIAEARIRHAGRVQPLFAKEAAS